VVNSLCRAILRLVAVETERHRAYKLGGMIGIGALLLACGTVRVAVAQDTVPTDAELRSAYCIPVLQSEIKMLSDAVASMDRWRSQNDQSFQQNPPSPDVQNQLRENQKQYLESTEKVREGIARRKSTLNRLQAYLLPRLMHLDPMAIALATKRGDADVQGLHDMSHRCGSQCGISDQIGGPDPDDKAKACFASCSDKDLVARLKACSTPTWLPF